MTTPQQPARRRPSAAPRRPRVIQPLGELLPQITQVVSSCAPAPPAAPPARVIFETSPGPAWVIVSVPGAPVPGSQVPYGLAFTWQVTSRPAAALPALIPVALTLALVPPPVRPVRTWQRDVQRYAIDTERERHVQALWQYGELAVFALLWAIPDLSAGLAQRCIRCFTPAVPEVSPEAQISAAYGQGNQYLCSLCYNSQLIAAAPAATPGLRALLVRPAILTDMDKDYQRTNRGAVQPGSLSAESTPDFRVRPGDFLLRSTGDRFRLQVPRRVTLRSGFASPWQQSAAITYNLSVAQLEDRAAVSSIVPPDNATLARWLGTYTRLPVRYDGLEIINGPLIPEEAPPPAASGLLQPDASFPLPVT